MKRVCLILTLLLINGFSFSQSRHISETVKKIVYTRDGGICKCCGSTQSLEYDHITPFSCGGESVASNIQLLCLKCNRSKSNSCFCKVHDKKVGTNCCDGNATRKKPSPAVQCTGTTKKGSRCKNRTSNSNGRCHLH
jgi:5-methylcytosine-specific restriction endonuclease McrA